MKRVKLSLVAIGIFIAILFVGCANHIKTGVSYLEAEKYEAAADVFEKEIEQKKYLDEAYRGLGIAQFELGNYAEAIEAFEAAIEAGTKENATIYSMMAASCVQTEEYEEALEYYAEALEQKDCTDTLRQEVQYNEIAVYQELGDWDTVKQKVTDYVKTYPDDKRMDKTAEFLETR